MSTDLDPYGPPPSPQQRAVDPLEVRAARRTGNRLVAVVACLALATSSALRVATNTNSTEQAVWTAVALFAGGVCVVVVAIGARRAGRIADAAAAAHARSGVIAACPGSLHRDEVLVLRPDLDVPLRWWTVTSNAYAGTFVATPDHYVFAFNAPARSRLGVAEFVFPRSSTGLRRVQRCQGEYGARSTSVQLRGDGRGVEVDLAGRPEAEAFVETLLTGARVPARRAIPYTAKLVLVGAVALAVAVSAGVHAAHVPAAHSKVNGTGPYARQMTELASRNPGSAPDGVQVVHVASKNADIQFGEAWGLAMCTPVYLRTRDLPADVAAEVTTVVDEAKRAGLPVRIRSAESTSGPGITISWDAAGKRVPANSHDDLKWHAWTADKNSTDAHYDSLTTTWSGAAFAQDADRAAMVRRYTRSAIAQVLGIEALPGASGVQRPVTLSADEFTDSDVRLLDLASHCDGINY